MSEPVFLRYARALTLEEVATIAGAEPPAAPLRARHIVNIAALDCAGPTDLAFFDKKSLMDAAALTHAGACLTTAALAKELPAQVAKLIVREPYRAFVQVTRVLFPHALRPSSLYEATDVQGAHLHLTARLEESVIIEPGAVIGPRVEIGSGTVVGATAVIGAEVRIGRDCSIGAGATLTNALIGDRVIIHPGCKIGQDGFGFVMDGKGHIKVPQIGRVIIQDDVEIGAGSTIDRGAIRDTVIGEGTKIDNMVQVGHNVSIGRHCVLVAQTGISGSVTIGDYAMLGGQVGVADHVNIGEGAKIAAKSGIMSDIPAGQRWAGIPATPRLEWLRGLAVMARLVKQSAGARTASPAAKSGDAE